MVRGRAAEFAGRLFSEVDRTFARIRELPSQFPNVAGEVRRALLHTFPYAVYFRASDQAVVVLAVLHLEETRKYGGDVREVDPAIRCAMPRQAVAEKGR